MANKTLSEMGDANAGAKYGIGVYRKPMQKWFIEEDAGYVDMTVWLRS